MWLDRTQLITDSHILEYCRQITVGHTTVLYYGEENCSDITRALCEQQGWDYQDISQFVGCEDNTVICLEDCVFYHESVSRARNKLILVTTRGR